MCKKVCLIFVLVGIFVRDACSQVTGIDLGSPAGFIPNCPGMNRTTTLSKQTRDALFLILHAGSSRQKYFINKKSARLLANNPLVDFAGKPTKVLITGYLDGTFSPHMRAIGSAYYERNYNVLMFETFPSLVYPYPIAARLTKPYGEVLGTFLADLREYGLQPNNLSMEGGSLGAHLAFFAAIKYQLLTGVKIQRLVALDPAGPCFRNVPSYARFNASSAEETLALHTNIEGFGLADPVAQVDFYANGGEFQGLSFQGFFIPCLVVCSHFQAAYIWLSVIQNPGSFEAVQCMSVQNARKGNCFSREPLVTNGIGVLTNFSLPGIYYLPLTDGYPYYKGKIGTNTSNFKQNFYIERLFQDKDITVK